MAAGIGKANGYPFTSQTSQAAFKFALSLQFVGGGKSILG